MQIRDLFVEDDAVSSVVSTVLMVAITIILVAVIGSFVLSMGGAVGEKVPSATLSITQANATCTGGGPGITITHQGGDVIATDQLSVTVNDEPAMNCAGDRVWSGSGEVSAGDSAHIVQYGNPSSDLSSGNRLVVVWKSPSGDKSYILTQYVVKG